MILTYKAQSDFWKWYLLPETLKSHKLDSMFKYSNGNAIKVNFLAESKVCQNALIIEWFDSVGIHVIVSPYSYAYLFANGADLIENDSTWSYFIYKGTKYISDGVDFENRTEATTKAIKRANVIYNNK